MSTQKTVLHYLFIVLILTIVLTQFFFISTAISGREKNYFQTSAGEYSKDFLRTDIYENLVAEIDYVKPTPPAEHTKTVIQTVLEKYCSGKKITVTVSDEIDDADTKEFYDVTYINRLELKYRDYRPSRFNRTTAIYFLYLNGSYLENKTVRAEVLGFAYHAASIVIFKSIILKSATQAVSADRLETAVVTHELGHLFGLVNIVYKSPTEHEASTDPADPGYHHCSNKDCVMYYQISIRKTGVESHIPTDFDEACKFDLQLLSEIGYDTNFMPWLVLLVAVGLTCTVTSLIVVGQPLLYENLRKLT